MSTDSFDDTPVNPHETYDVVVIGGGVNGTGIANDAAGRGLSVALLEQDDLAAHTSSASSKLIHGGLRYLEHYEFRLVREALAEREVLLKNAPFLIYAQEFILPHQRHLRPWWLIRAGLFLYDHLSSRQTLAGAKGVRFDSTSPLKATMHKGFSYSDCWVDDARLVVLNAVQAAQRGADILTYCRCDDIKHSGNVWNVSAVNRHTNTPITLKAKAVVNAAGPWAQSLLENQASIRSPRSIRLIRGSHLVMPRFYDGDHAYILQNHDQRIVFIVPYFDDYVMVGTTDEAHKESASNVNISESETDYLLNVLDQYFKRSFSRSDIIHTYSGVRPLCDDESSDPSAITRDYTVQRTENSGQPPLVTVFGGKLTTYRKLSEAAVDQLTEHFPQMQPHWTAHTPLVGGESGRDRNTLAKAMCEARPWLPESLARRWARQFGDRTEQLLESIQSESDLGKRLGGDLYEHEVKFLVQTEWARTAEDILWRRTKVGLVAPNIANAVQSIIDKCLATVETPHHAEGQL